MLGPIFLFDALAGRWQSPQYEITQRLGGQDVYIAREGDNYALTKTADAAQALLFRTQFAANLAINFCLVSTGGGSLSVQPSDFKITSRAQRPQGRSWFGV
jgi:hypothetical protein